jgi:epsilon-lactone hydrolase
MRRAPRTHALAMGAVMMGFAGLTAADIPAQLDDGGTLHVPPLSLPPSELWSPEFKKAYIEHLRQTLNAPGNFGLPKLNAPKGDWDAFDAAFNRALAPSLAWDKKHFRANVVESEIAGVRVATITPKDGVSPQNAHRVLINLHGFAHGLGQGEVESIPIASIGKIKIITLDYRLEPQYQYPASSEDAAAVYQELLKEYKPSSIGIFGSSGGGVLSSQVIAWLQLKGLPRPGAVGIFWSGLANAPFPWGKIGDSKMWGFRAVPLSDTSEVDKLHADLGSSYLGAVNDNDASAYPGASDKVLAKFPPTLFLSGTRAVDMSPSISSHAHLLKLGVDSSLYLIEGGWHGANSGRTEDSPEEHDANAYIARWFAQHLAR